MQSVIDLCASAALEYFITHWGVDIATAFCGRLLCALTWSAKKKHTLGGGLYSYAPHDEYSWSVGVYDFTKDLANIFG